jgi:DNA-binding response OmpR family regulator
MTDDQNVILLVDDTPSKRYVLASWLRRGGYAVIEAATGGEALARFRQGGINLVVLDVRLPDMTGFEVCEQIKADPTFGTTPVIHVSAAAIHAVDRTHGLERGADAYLVEPIDPDELLATVAAILRYYQARLEAERLAARLADLARVTVAMNATIGERALLREAVAGATRIFAAPAAIVSTGADGARLIALCAGVGEPAVVRPSVADLDEAPVGVAVHDQPVARWPQQEWPGVTTLRVVTVRSRADRPAISVTVPVGATLAGAPVLTLFGQALMSAMETTRLYDEEHDLALTLQRSLLPREMPHVPELDLAVRYVPASDRAEIGGDFYEVVQFDNCVSIAVGDVGGHSLHAATIMAEVRHATRAYLAEGHGPAAVIDRLNRLMQTLIPGEIATICLLAIDITTGRVRLANAGHPPPLHRSGDRIHMITAHTPLLGIQVRAATEIEFDLAPGDTLLLYTDGLIETRDEDLDNGLRRLQRAAMIVETDLEAFASRLLAEVGPTDPGDDIAMVAVRRVAV